MQEIESVYLVTDLADVPAEVSRLRGYGRDVAYDIETTDTDPINSRIVMLQFKPKGKKATIIDVRQFTPLMLMQLGSMLEPLFDGTVTLVGHNLKFDLEFALAQMKLGAHSVYDTMLAEQVILGLGWSSGNNRGIHFGMPDLAERYGLPVTKEERSWFIGLDKRIEGQVKSQVGVERTEETIHRWYYDGVEIEDLNDVDIADPRTTFDAETVVHEKPVFDMVGGKRPWDEPLPVEQIRYARQDVSIVHKFREYQAASIEAYGLAEVVSLEMRALLPLVGIEVWGVQINREGWLSVIDRVSVIASDLERTLHLGVQDSPNPGNNFDGLDIHVLKVREEKYLEKWHPYEDWMKARDAFVATRKVYWEEHQSRPPIIEGYKNWSEYKKAMLDQWYERHGKQTKPQENKKGVNLGSWMQVRDGFNDLGIPVKSVSEETLTPYIGKHPLVQVYIDYSHARKIETVYGRERGKKERAFIELLDVHNRLRASYQQIGADTGRMSSYNPNFQQIPSDGVGSELRKHVVASDGHTLVVADFSNIELRIVAELSGDRFLLDAFASGEDIHAYTAGIMFGLKSEQTNKDWTNSHNAVVGGKEIENTSYRKVAKTINYMLLYGAGKRRLAAMLRITEEDADKLLKLYYKTFATAIGWLNEQKGRLDAAKKRNEWKVYSETRSGRRRWFDIPHYPKYPGNGARVTVDEIDEFDLAVETWKQQMASIKRQLANTPIQGLSADITKEAAALWYERVGYDPGMKLVAIIHDELVIEVLEPFAGIAARLLEECMMQAMQKYLKVVELGEVHAVETPYWMH